MVELDIIKCIRTLNPDIKHIAGNQDGVHPTSVFFIAEMVDSYNLGGSTKVLSSETGDFLSQQSKEYAVRLSFQGRYDSDAFARTETLQIHLEDNFHLKDAFNKAGYSYRVDGQILPIPMDRDTSRYIRYSFMLYLSTSISTVFNNDTIGAVDVHGKVKDKYGGIEYEYEERIEE